MGIWTVSKWKPLAPLVSWLPALPWRTALPTARAEFRVSWPCGKAMACVPFASDPFGDTIWCPRIGRLRGNQDAPERQQHQPDGESAPNDAPDDRRNEGRARQRVRVRAAGPRCEMKQVVADVVQRIAAGERGQEHQHSPPEPGSPKRASSARASAQALTNASVNASRTYSRV